MNGREQLAAYIDAHFPSRADFARRAEISEPHLSLYLQGRRELSVPMARKVCEAAGNVVTLKALLPPELAGLIGSAA